MDRGSNAASQISLTRPLELDWSLQMTRPETTLAFRYWGSKCRDRLMPTRADLSPREMKPFMRNVGLIEVHARPGHNDYLIRLAGSQWEQVFGPMKGRFLREFLPEQIENRWRLLFDSVCNRAKPVRATTRVAFKDMSWLTTEMFVAPLGDDGTTIAMLLMCFTSWSDIEG